MLVGLRVTGTVVGEDIDGSSDTLTLPTGAGGNTAEWVLVTVSGAAYVLPVASGGSVSSTTGIILGAGGSILLNVKGYAAIAHLQVTAAGQITVAPVDPIWR